ncbi:Myosin type-2 heavy chain 1 [Blyttiomyces sp. JEL0837]|nr:Myosin type-2 heavy chain 1 [Blyttiomyces sp. JEL0837]
MASSENPLEVFVKGTKAWFPDETEGWIQGTMKEKTVTETNVKLVFGVDSRGKDVVFESPMDKLVASKFADLPHLKNPPMLEGIDDLSNLSYLHEPAVLHNVRLRYLQEQIYTYSGIVLIAMNPFQRLALYSPDIMREYSGKRRGELEPHLFAVAEEAYRTMIREKKNQSIIVSGESGAGKTQSAKYIMRYFAIVDDLEKKTSSNSGSGGTSEIEEAVLSTNPIMEALSTVGVSVTTQWDIFKICAALLHIGNIKVTAIRDEAQVADDDPALIQAAKLLGLNKSDFKKWIVKKQIITRSEKIVTSLNQYQATVGKDSIAKFIYSMLFDWLVKIVNINLDREDASATQTFIGVLDIYGFEHFKKNSFEQFCINYANEKLQQEFNQHVFKLEQEEYINEKINWSFIDFNDNQPCIDMIENKLGILDLLDEESRLPSGADASLITKLYQRFAVPTNKFFEKPRFGQKAFTIKHYATDVTYEIDGFIEKNKDTVSDEQLAVLNAGDFAFLKEVITVEEDPAAIAAAEAKASGGRGAGAQSKKPTLGAIFKASLVKLMATLRTTEVHYIRCIKPNQTKTAFGFEPQMEFADRYYLIVPSKKWVTDPKALTTNIVQAAISKEDLYQMGITKIFFRAGQLAYLEKLRSEKLRECVVMIQKNIRRLIYGKKYRVMRKSATKIQTAFRGYRARQQYRAEREKRAAIKIQTAVRRWLAVKKYKKIRAAVVKIQATYRMHVATKQLVSLRQKRAAIRIQKVFRGYRARKVYKRQLRQIILLQSCVRRRRAMKELKQLKVEAKSVGKLKELNYKLENKVVELSQSVKSRDEEIKAMVEKISNLESQVSSWKEKFSRIETNSKATAIQSVEVSKETKAELKALQDAKDALTKDNERLNTVASKKDIEIESLTSEVAKQKEEIRKLKEDIKNMPKGEDTAVTSSLRKEVASLREQMSRLIAGKWTRDRVADSLLQNTAEGGYGYANERVSTAQQNAQTALYGHSDQLEAEAAIASRPRPQSVNDIAVPPSPVDSPRLGRKSTISTRSSLMDGSTVVGDDRTVETERSVKTLEDKALEDEIIDALITNLRIPLPSTQTVATKKEIFFPAHLIGTCMNQLLQHDLGARMQAVMSNVMKAIQNLTMKFEDDYVSAFWLSNCFELLSVVRFTQDKESHEQSRRRLQAGRRGSDASESERALDKVRNDLDYILIEIYHGWIKELKKRLANMIVPAVIENQSLPGYICKQSGGIWGKWGKSSATSQFTIEQLLNFLSKLSKTMRCYYMEESMTRQILTELLRVIGVSAFNHLLMRKNFCTWKRGVQIQYNVSRLEEWCTSHGIAEATLHLQQLLQAAKLLTLNKTSPQDIETIFDVCFLLNPTQIKKLLSLYYAADFDSPLSPELLKIVASRAILNEKSDVLLLDLEQSPDFAKPNIRPVDNIDKFIPAWISLPHISAIVSAS